VALLTFTLGRLAVATASLPFFFLCFALVGVGVVAAIVALVVYQGAVLKREWRPVIGKGTLSLLFWVFPSLWLLCFNLMFYVRETTDWDGRPLPRPVEEGLGSSFDTLLMLSFTLVYGLMGAGLCLWVKAPESERPTIWENTRWGALS
jgi:hypothetical protein